MSSSASEPHRSTELVSGSEDIEAVFGVRSDDSTNSDAGFNSYGGGATPLRDGESIGVLLRAVGLNVLPLTLPQAQERS